MAISASGAFLGRAVRLVLFQSHTLALANMMHVLTPVRLKTKGHTAPPTEGALGTHNVAECVIFPKSCHRPNKRAASQPHNTRYATQSGQSERQVKVCGGGRRLSLPAGTRFNPSEQSGTLLYPHGQKAS